MAQGREAAPSALAMKRGNSQKEIVSGDAKLS